MNKWYKFLFPNGSSLWICLIFFHLTISSLIGWLTPQVTQTFYESLTDSSLFKTQIIFLTFFFLAEYLNRIFYQLSTNMFVNKLLINLRSITFSRWIHSPLKVKRGALHSDDFPMGEVMARIMSDTEAVKELITSGCFALLIDIVFVISCLAGFLKLNSKIGLSLFMIELGACLLLLWGSRAMAKIFNEVRKLIGFMSRDLTDLTGGLKELYFSKHHHYASKRGDLISENFLKTQLKANIWDASYYSAAESLYPILLAIVLVLVPSQEILSLVLLAVLIDLIQKSISPIKEMASKISSLQRAQTGFKRILDFHELFIEDKREMLSLPMESKLSVHFHSFQYGKGFKLHPLKFEIMKGQLLAIIGYSGSGKSTFLKLLSGLHGEFSADIKWGDKSINLPELSSLVSLVSQESHVFSDSLRFNLTLGKELVVIENFYKSVSDSIPYLKEWNLDLDSVLNPSTLSVGQKQLITGLRALYLKKPIILLDEISTGLDSKLERALRDLLELTQKDSMTIVVTHRLETILHAKEIILMEEGKVIGQGSREDLKNNNPHFRSFLSEMQN